MLLGFGGRFSGVVSFFKNYKKISVILLPEPEEAEESSNECGLSSKLLSITLSAGGPQCHCSPV